MDLRTSKRICRYATDSSFVVASAGLISQSVPQYPPEPSENRPVPASAPAAVPVQYSTQHIRLPCQLEILTSKFSHSPSSCPDSAEYPPHVLGCIGKELH